MIWKFGHLGIWKSATAATALLMLQAAGPEHNDAYRRVVEDFATQPGAAVERMLALPSADVARAVRDAARADAGWTAEALNRALLMHGDAIVGLGDNRSGEVGAQIALADELAGAAARLPGNAWFVHRWYKAFTSRVPAGVVESHWRQQEWYRAAAAVDRARELEADGGHATMRADLESMTRWPSGKRCGCSSRVLRGIFPWRRSTSVASRCCAATIPRRDGYSRPLKQSSLAREPLPGVPVSRLDGRTRRQRLRSGTQVSGGGRDAAARAVGTARVDRSPGASEPQR